MSQFQCGGPSSQNPYPSLTRWVEILHALHEWKVEADYSSAVRLLEPFVRQLEQKEDSLADIAGKTRNVPENCDLLTVARRMGISLG